MSKFSPFKSPVFTDDFIYLSETETINQLVAAGIQESRNARNAAYSDELFLQDGLRRVFERCASGREYLQMLQQEGRDLAKASYFDALSSERRGRLTTDVAASIKRHCAIAVARAGINYLADLPELSTLDVVAVDGHAIEHGCHDPKDKRERSVPVTAIYGLDLRNGMAQSLAVNTVAGARRHEMPIFREWLSSNPPRRDTVFVGDPAYVNHEFWWRQVGTLGGRSGPKSMIVTRAKSDMAPNVCGTTAFDPSDPVNCGVRSVRLAGFGSSPALFYLIAYDDPETGERYDYVTTVDLSEGSGIRPGAVVALYKLRWQIEKAYDNFKNNLAERKAWASGLAAATVQTTFIANAYNLLRMFAALLEAHGVTDNKVLAKRREWLAKRQDLAAQKNRQIHPLEKKLNRMARLSSQFIRAVRHHLKENVALLALLPQFRRFMNAYL